MTKMANAKENESKVDTTNPMVENHGPMGDPVEHLITLKLCWYCKKENNAFTGDYGRHLGKVKEQRRRHWGPFLFFFSPKAFNGRPCHQGHKGRPNGNREWTREDLDKDAFSVSSGKGLEEEEGNSRQGQKL